MSHFLYIQVYIKNNMRARTRARLARPKCPPLYGGGHGNGADVPRGALRTRTL
jgi:hypothetical protein